MASHRLVIAIPDGTLAAYPRSTLTILEETPTEVHVVLPESPAEAFAGTPLSRSWIEARSTGVYRWGNIGAPMASGSWPSAGMFVVPCPTDVVRDIAQGFTANLITRSADVMLKERTPLVILPSAVEWDGPSLDHLCTITEAGGMIYPPLPSMYMGANDTEAMVDRIVKRALSVFDVPVDIQEWGGISTG